MTQPKQHYDIIFAGSGLAAHMMLFFMSENDFFIGKSILIIDSANKTINDRTWCFWEQENGVFDTILHRSWDEAVFYDSLGEVPLNLHPYRYKMIRSGSFYAFVKKKLTNLEITWLQDEVIDINENNIQANVHTPKNSFTANLVFNSLFNPKSALASSKYPYLQQHFIGFFIVTDKPVFNSNRPVFMDFSIAQKGNTRFMYVLPISDKEALVEYTLFSKELLQDNEYEHAIDVYLKSLGTAYTIIEKEQGAIPMTCYPFAGHKTSRVLPIGSAGGWTKPSTGYTFKNSIKQARKLCAIIAKGKSFKPFPLLNRFWFYDLLLLDILSTSNEKGSIIFSSMFRKGRTNLIFKFLDEDTSLLEDLKVIWSCPKLLFIKALLQRLFKY